MATTPDQTIASASAPKRTNSVLRGLKAVVEAPLFVAALVVVAFNELLDIVAAPAKVFVKDLSFKKIVDDLHHAEETLKQSRLVKNITGKIWPWVPAAGMMALLVGIPLVAIIAKGAWLLHFTPYAALTQKIPFLAPFIGSSSAALTTLVGTAIAAKVAKLPAIIIATCCPQFKDTWLHQNINIPVINGLAYIGRKSQEFVERRTQGIRAKMANINEAVRTSWPVRAAKSAAKSIISAVSYITPKRKAPKPIDPSTIKPESNFQTNARTALHTLLIYGTSTAIPAATLMTAVAGFAAGKAGVAAAATGVGLSVGTILTYTGIGVGILAGGMLGAAVVLGGIYGAARMSRSLFSRAAKGVCEVGESADVATAQAMHEGLLLGTTATFGVAEHFIHAKEAILGTIAAGGALALFGGWKKIHAEYERINDVKRRNLDPTATSHVATNTLQSPSTATIRERIAAMPRRIAKRLSERARQMPYTRSDIEGLQRRGQERTTMLRLVRAQRPVMQDAKPYQLARAHR